MLASIVTLSYPCSNDKGSIRTSVMLGGTSVTFSVNVTLWLDGLAVAFLTNTVTL